jgi:hypothetical protein
MSLIKIGGLLIMKLVEYTKTCIAVDVSGILLEPTLGAHGGVAANLLLLPTLSQLLSYLPLPSPPGPPASVCICTVLTDQIPRSYKALRLHIQKHHAEVLAPFDAGWDSLPAKVQAIWTHPQVAVGTNFQEWWGHDVWWSWTHEMHDEHELRRRNEKEDKKTYKEQKVECVRVICDNMAHEGTLVRMPPLLDDGLAVPVPFISGSLLKEELVCKLVEEYFFQVRSKAAEWLKEKVEREGVMFLEPLLNKHEIIEITDKSS